MKFSLLKLIALHLNVKLHLLPDYPLVHHIWSSCRTFLSHSDLIALSILVSAAKLLKSLLMPLTTHLCVWNQLKHLYHHQCEDGLYQQWHEHIDSKHKAIAVLSQVLGYLVTVEEREEGIDMFRKGICLGRVMRWTRGVLQGRIRDSDGWEWR